MRRFSCSACTSTSPLFRRGAGGVGGEMPILRILIATATPCSGLLFDSAHSAQLRGASLLACQPHSGRTHQIRVHCQHVGHPLLGDELYGVQVGNGEPGQPGHAAKVKKNIEPATGREGCQYFPVASCQLWLPVFPSDRFLLTAPPPSRPLLTGSLDCKAGTACRCAASGAPHQRPAVAPVSAAA